MLQATTTSYATSSAQRYFAQINNNGQPNATALQLIAAAPQTIAPAISWTMINLRPYKYVPSWLSGAEKLTIPVY